MWNLLFYAWSMLSWINSYVITHLCLPSMSMKQEAGSRQIYKIYMTISTFFYKFQKGNMIDKLLIYINLYICLISGNKLLNLNVLYFAKSEKQIGQVCPWSQLIHKALDEGLRSLVQIPALSSVSCTTWSNFSEFGDIGFLLWKRILPTSQENIRFKYDNLYQSTLPSNLMGKVSY